MKRYKTAITLFAIFEAIAVSLWLATGNHCKKACPAKALNKNRNKQI